MIISPGNAAWFHTCHSGRMTGYSEIVRLVCKQGALADNCCEQDYHYVSQFEIDGAKRISQHLSGNRIRVSYRGYRWSPLLSNNETF
jgi:hypothetical protein